jgi:hypothetical protein
MLAQAIDLAINSSRGRGVSPKAARRRLPSRTTLEFGEDESQPRGIGSLDMPTAEGVPAQKKFADVTSVIFDEELRCRLACNEDDTFWILIDAHDFSN